MSSKFPSPVNIGMCTCVRSPRAATCCAAAFMILPRIPTGCKRGYTSVWRPRWLKDDDGQNKMSSAKLASHSRELGEKYCLCSLFLVLTISPNNSSKVIPFHAPCWKATSLMLGRLSSLKIPQCHCADPSSAALLDTHFMEEVFILCLNRKNSHCGLNQQLNTFSTKPVQYLLNKAGCEKLTC